MENASAGGFEGRNPSLYSLLISETSSSSHSVPICDTFVCVTRALATLPVSGSSAVVTVERVEMTVGWSRSAVAEVGMEEDNFVVVAVETVENMVVGVDVFDVTVDVTVFP